jgi:hypothetical protein
MDYVTYDDAGNLTGGYCQDLQPAHADAYIEVAPDIRLSWSSYRANADRSGLELVDTGAPAVIVPRQVTMRQARLALLDAGLLQTVKDAVAGMTEAAQIEWECAAVVDRDSGLLESMSSALGLTDAQLDALFSQAVTL